MTARRLAVETTDGIAITRASIGVGDILRRCTEPAASFGLPFVLIVYLGLRGGGYDVIVRSEVGIVAWWVLLLGIAVSALPRTRLPAPAWVGLGLLAAYGIWTAVGITWSESSERSTAEAARVATLLGLFALILFTQGRESLRRTAAGIGAGIALVGCVALASRLQPHWFPSDVTAEALGAARSRLNYPLDYWNGLATLLAMGIPLLVAGAAQARHALASGLSAGIVPALILAAFYTFSRGGAAEIALALTALIALHPRRLALLTTVAPAAVGSALLVGAATQRDALESGMSGALAQQQGDEMTALTLIVCGGVGLLQAAIAMARKHGLGPRIRIGRGARRATIGSVVLVVVAGGLALGAPEEISDKWREFKESPEPAPTGASRFESTAAAGRYELWKAAVEAFETQPVTGIGAGTYEFWKARTSDHAPFVRDAHSLYLESLAELGLIGFVGIVGFVGLVLAVGTACAIRGVDLDRRGFAAAAFAACVAFTAAAAVDWAWELTVLPVAFLALAAAVLGVGGIPRSEPETLSNAARFVLALVAVAGLVGIALPLATTSSLRTSQAKAEDGQLSASLGHAQRAETFQPNAASPPMQQALVLEEQGAWHHAIRAAQKATAEEPTNWRTWLVRSRIEARLGRVEASIASFRRARSLNPHSQLFK